VIGPLGHGRWAVTPGGRADFEREYGGVTPRRATSATKPQATAPAAPKRQTKLSYKDERRAAEIDALLPQLSQEIETLEQQMADPDLFARDPKKFEQTIARIEAARGQRDAIEAEWLEIELKREALSVEE
jgi:ATP-binding cassette subfamily F protein uup